MDTKVSVIIVSYNGFDNTKNAIESVRRFSPPSEIVVVDNCSTDGSFDMLSKHFPQTTFVPLSENRGFGSGCNRGAENAAGKYFFFLNNDAFLREDSCNVLASLLEENLSLGACGPKLLNADGSFQLSFGLDPSMANEWRVRRMMRRVRNGDQEFSRSLERRFAGKRVDWVTGAALMIRREVFESVGGFDENFFMYFEDADLCRRVRKEGFAIHYVPQTAVVHLLGGTTKGQQTRVSLEYRKSQLYYYRKHRSGFSRRLLTLYLLGKGFNIDAIRKEDSP